MHSRLLDRRRSEFSASIGRWTISDIAWETARSIDWHAVLPSAWADVTNVANWDDRPATFELEGTFTAGSRGTTRMPG